MNCIGSAVFARERSARRTNREEGCPLLLRDGGHSDTNAGIGTAKNHCEAVTVSPFAKFLRSNIGLVLMVRDHKLNFVPEDTAAKIVDGHLGGFDATWPDDIGIQAGHVIDVANHHLIRCSMSDGCNTTKRGQRDAVP
jgi:hypothetical protein